MGNSIDRSDRLRRLLDINDDRIILLSAGGMNDSDCTIDLILESRQFPDNFCLVLHSSNGNYSPGIIHAASQFPDRVILSTLKFSAEEASNIIYPGADIGIVFYRNNEINQMDTVFSSGKLAAFLRAGIPTLLPLFPQYRELLDHYKVGLQSSVTDISISASVILNNYPYFRSQALQAYDAIYNYKNYSGLVVESLRSSFNVD
jgi:hypothetical protein